MENEKKENNKKANEFRLEQQITIATNQSVNGDKSKKYSSVMLKTFFIWKIGILLDFLFPGVRVCVCLL